MSPLLLGAWLAVSAGALPARAEPLSSDDVVRSALQHDPAYLSALASVGAARGELRASSFLRENPSVSGELSLTSDRLGAEIAQPLSITGEGLAARQAASQRHDAAELDAHHAALVSAAAARGAFADAIATEARAAIAAQALEQASARRQAIEARVAAGDAAPLDARLARLLEGQSAAALVSARSEALAARVGLARFVPDAVAAELPDDPMVTAPAPTGVAGERADLDAAEQRVRAAAADRRAARAAVLPALSVGAFVERDGDVLSAGPSVGLTLPLWHGNPAGIGAADAAVATTSAEAAALRATVATERAGADAVRRLADDALGRLSVPPGDDARAALAALDDAQARGELDLGTVTLLRAEVLDAWSASVDLRRAVAAARIHALLVTGDPALLPPELHPAARREARP